MWEFMGIRRGVLGYVGICRVLGYIGVLYRV